MSPIADVARVSPSLPTIPEVAVEQSTTQRPSKGAWRQTIGMFANDPVMDAIIDGALRAREEDRAKELPE